jgi:Tol biopolymer transport system component
VAALITLKDRFGTTVIRPQSVPVQLTHFSTSVREPAISPDGRQLTFVVQEPHSSTSQVYVMALPDGRPQQLTRGPGTKAWPAFSPDGSRIAYTVAGEEWQWDTWVVGVTGATDPQLMLRNANSLQWLKDGRVLFSEFKIGSQLGVAISDEGRGDSRDVYVPARNGMAHYSDVSPDGSRVVIGEMGTPARTRPGAEQIRTHCFVMPLSGGSKREIGSDSVPCIQLARWSRDGFIYFVSGGPQNYQVWREPGDGGAAEPVTAGQSLALRGVVPGGFALSPDGTTLTYSVGDTQESLWLRRSDGTEQQLTFEGDSRSPVVTADGRQAFYIGGPRFTAGSIHVRRLDTAEDRVLAGGRPAVAVWPSPDGSRFVFRGRESDRRMQLWLGVTDNSSAPRPLSGGDNSVGDVVFAGDGSVMYLARSVEGGMAMWSLDLASENMEQISEPVPSLNVVALSPDGQWLSVLRPDVTPRETWLYPTRRGPAPRRLYKLWRFEWAPGNRSFLVSNSGMISTAWSIPNPRRSVLPPAFDGEPTPLKLEQVGGRKVLVADSFVDPTPLPDPFSIIYSNVEGRSNLFQIPLSPPRYPENARR